MKYVLLKDLPGTPAGTVFQKTGNVYQVGKPGENAVWSLHEKIVENQPEWFGEANSVRVFNPEKAEFEPLVPAPVSNPKKRGRPAGKAVVKKPAKTARKKK
jgi:hypothetical protein